MHEQDHENHAGDIPGRDLRQSSDDSHAQACGQLDPRPRDVRRRSGIHLGAEENACINANPHGAQFEQGGKYPGTRTPGDPYYQHDMQDGHIQQEMEDCICDALRAWLGEDYLHAYRIKVCVQDSMAIITGNVPDHQMLAGIEGCVHGCAGIKGLVNRVRVVFRGSHGC